MLFQTTQRTFHTNEESFFELFDFAVTGDFASLSNKKAFPFQEGLLAILS